LVTAFLGGVGSGVGRILDGRTGVLERVAGAVERVAGGLESGVGVFERLVDGVGSVGVALIGGRGALLAGSETERGYGDESESDLLHGKSLQIVARKYKSFFAAVPKRPLGPSPGAPAKRLLYGKRGRESRVSLLLRLENF
jgi:hypothetical protein